MGSHAAGWGVPWARGVNDQEEEEEDDREEDEGRDDRRSPILEEAAKRRRGGGDMMNSRPAAEKGEFLTIISTGLTSTRGPRHAGPQNTL